MFATPGVILAQDLWLDARLNKNYESHVYQILKVLGIVNFLHFVIE